MAYRSKIGPLILILVILGLVTYLLLPPAHQSPPKAIRQKKIITENLRVIATHADQYVVERDLGTGEYSFTFQDLLENYPEGLSALESTDGEVYSDLEFNEDTRLLKVETDSGATITYSW